MSAATGLDYMIQSVERIHEFASAGHQTGPIIKMCWRGILPREIRRYPDLAGKGFLLFNWDRENNKVLDPVLMTRDEAVALFKTLFSPC